MAGRARQRMQKKRLTSRRKDWSCFFPTRDSEEIKEKKLKEKKSMSLEEKQ